MHVPSNWKMSDIGSFVTHKKGFAFQSSSFSPEKGRRVIRVSDTSANSIKTDSPIYLAEIEASQYKDYELHSGDIILTTVGSRPPLYDSMVGKAIKVPDSIDGALLNQNMVRLTPIVALIKPDYLYSLLKTKRFIFYIEKSVRGNANQVSITLDDIFNFPVLLPPLSEQQKIAQILSTWDKAIEKLEALIAAKQKRKKALMQQLLTCKKRFAGFEGDWKEVKLGDIFSKITNGLTYDTDAVAGLPVTRIETISTGKINYDKVGWAPTEENTMRFALQCGDILYSHINSLEHIGRVAIYCAEQPLYHGMNLLLLRANEKVLPEFIFHILNSRIGKKYAKSYAKSAVNQASISTTDVKSFKVKIPPLPEQQIITSVFSTADQEIETHQKQLSALKEQKKGLMQQLLTGKLRVIIEDKEAA